MPLSTIAVEKEQSRAAQPLLLATFTFADGATLRVTTQDLTGGFQYAGADYLPRVLSYTTPRKQIFSDTGADVVPSVTLRLADADEWIYTNYARLKGFKGARLNLTFLFREPAAANFSSDTIQFSFVCAPPAHENNEVTVTGVSRLNLAAYQIPTLRVQKLCPWVFPSTAAERVQAADDPTSPFWFCGYSHDAGGPNARGNAGFTDCDYTKEACQARGMYTQDSLTRITGRFGGIQYAPPQSAMVRGYRSKFEEVFNNSNEAKYGDLVPLLYGEGWIEPLLLNAIPSGNDNSFEHLICAGEIDYIHEVLVNDVKVPHTFNDAEFPNVPPGVTSTQQALLGGFWGLVNRGDRDGKPGRDGNGDPYGNLAVINIVVPRKLADANSVPRVRILARGPKVRVYSDANNFTLQFTQNPAWTLLDLLAKWGPFSYTDFDLDSFVAVAARCDDLINRKDQFGATVTVKRFQANLILRQRRSLAEVVRGLLNAFKAYITENNQGKLKIALKETMGEQQPAPVVGSNYATPIASLDYPGAAKNGYAAYRFDASSILDEDQGDPVSIALADPQPNRISFVFQNADNRYSDDEATIVDAADVGRLGREESGGLPIEAIPTFDQARRAGATMLAEALRGNPGNNTQGTYIVSLSTTFKAVHLQLGQIVLVDWAKKSLVNQPMRVIGIEPYDNWHKCRLTLRWHSDAWYVDTFGQKDAPLWNAAHRNRLERPPFAWTPGDEYPKAGDPLYAVHESTFAIKPEYETGADDGRIVRVSVRGIQTVNEFVEALTPPFIPLQGNVSTVGGTIAGNLRVFLAVVAEDAAGNCSQLSESCWFDIPAGTNTNQLTIPKIVWPATAVGYRVFGGGDASRPTLQARAAGTPATITVSALKISDAPAPDPEFDRYRLQVKRIKHAGVIGIDVQSVTATTITLRLAGLTIDQFAGYEVSLLGKATAGLFVPFFNARIASNDGNTLTLQGGFPDPSAWMAPGDVVVIRSKPTIGQNATGHYVEDAAWANVTAPAGLPVNSLTGFQLRCTAGPGFGMVVRIKENTATRIYIEGDWPVTPTSGSRFIVEEPSWQVIVDGASASNRNLDALVTMSVDVTNYQRQTVLVKVLTVDGGNTESYDAISPQRELYLFGVGEDVTRISADTTLTLQNQVVEFDTAGGNRTATGVDPRFMKGRFLKLKKVASANTAIFDPPGTVDGAATLELSALNESAILYSDGNEYKVISRSSGAVAGSVFYQAVALGAVANNISPAQPPANGSVLCVVLTNSVADPGAITWDAAFVNGQTNISPANGAVTVVMFVGAGTKWRYVSSQTGQS